MFFRKDDDKTNLEKLLKNDTADRKQLARSLAELEALRPRWTTIQEQAENLAALYQANDMTYTREISATFWDERSLKLKAQIDELVKQRDALTAGREVRITEIKNRLYHRHEAIVSAYSAWTQQIAEKLPPALAAELAQVRVSAQQSQDLAAVTEMIADIVERVSDLDGPIILPVLSLGAVVRQALAIGSAATE